MPWIGSAPNQTPQRGDGTRTGSETWQEADAAGVRILSSAHDTHDEDLATMIGACLKRDGGNAPSAAIPFNDQRLTGLGAPTARTDAMRLDRVQDSTVVYAGTSSGTDTITATLTPAITALVAGQRYHFKAGGTNTGAATLNLNSLGATALRKGAAGGTALGAGDITTGGMYSVLYDGSVFQLENPGLGRNISAFMATVLDDADASTARGTLGLGSIATQASSSVSISGGSITGITDIAVADGGTGASTAAGARTNLGAVLADAVFPGAIIAIIEHRQTQNTNGGGYTSGSDATVPLTNLVYNRNSAVSLSSNQFTLPAGTYFIKWRSPAYQVDLHQSLLYNITAAATTARGTSEQNENAESDVYSNASEGSVVVTLAGSTVFEVRHRAQSSSAVGALGLAANFGTEVYARVEIYAA